MKTKRALARTLGLFLLWSSVPILTGQSNAIDPEFKKYLVYQVDRRSLPEALLNLVGLTSQDVGRSFALIAGVSRYPRMQQTQYRYLAPADRDIDLVSTYLKNQQFFDEIVILRDDAVSFDNLRYFLETYFPNQLRKYKKSRFLFAYSGHGMTEGDSGYLLTSTATSLGDKQHSIDMFALRGFSKQTIEAAYQSLFLINACHSGAFTGISREGPWDVMLGRPGAHAIMSSGAKDSSFGEADRGSFFYQKLIDGLNGDADTTGKGVITVADLGAFLQIQVGLATGGKQVPTLPQDLWTGPSDGGIFFFNRRKAVGIADLPVWNPSGVPTFGGNVATGELDALRPDTQSTKKVVDSTPVQTPPDRTEAHFPQSPLVKPTDTPKDTCRFITHWLRGMPDQDITYNVDGQQLGTLSLRQEDASLKHIDFKCSPGVHQYGVLFAPVMPGQNTTDGWKCGGSFNVGTYRVFSVLGVPGQNNMVCQIENYK